MKSADAFSPKAVIVHYCFAMVLAGCIGVSLNSKLFDEAKPTSAIEVTAEGASIGTLASETPIELWSGCPTHDGVRESIDALQELISTAENIVATMRENHDRWNENERRTNIPEWNEQARLWKDRNDSIISWCPQLLGATGVAVFPEIPMALENLRSSQNWLNFAIKGAAKNDFKTANEFIEAANKAAARAEKLIDLKVKPKTKTGVVKLPWHLQKRMKEIAFL